MVGLPVLGAPRHARSAGRWPITSTAITAVASRAMASTSVAGSAWGGGSVGDRRPSTLLLTPRSTATALVRPVAELVVRHPVAALTILGTRLLGWPLRRCLPTAVALDQLLPVALARHPAPLPRFLRLWTLACRFHRRWPSSLTKADTALGRQVSIDSVTTRVADGSSSSPEATNRPVPPLARLPHRIEGTTVAWAIDLDATVDPQDLSRHAGGLSLMDPRILRVELERRPTMSTDRPDPTDTAWEVVVDFDVEPPAWTVSRPGRGQVLATTNAPTPQHHDQQEGRADGKG